MDKVLAKPTEIFEYLEAPLPNDTRYDDFFLLLDRPWFRRTWIIQEAAVAEEGVVVCGSSRVRFDKLLQAVDFCTSLYLPPNTNLDRHETHFILRLLETWFMKSFGFDQYLLQLLNRHRSSLASDPRDKVYALCGLADDVGTFGMTIEPYPKIDIAQLYVETAITIIMYHNSLDLLTIPPAQYGEEGIAGLPSWVPDWTLPSIMCFSFRRRNIKGELEYDFQATNNSLCRPRFSNQQRQIILEGINFDVIQEIGDVMQVSASDAKGLRSLNSRDVAWLGRVIMKEFEVYKSWESLSRARSKRSYVTGIPILHAYWQCLLASCHEYDCQDGETTRGIIHAWSEDFYQWDRTRYPLRLLAEFLGYMGVRHFPWLFAVLMMPMLFIFSLYYSRIWFKFSSRLIQGTWNRRMMRTKGGYIGLVPMAARKGDYIFLCKGAQVPLILRRCGLQSYVLVGDSFVHGIMHGEAYDEAKCREIWLH
jgi:hypothetical protein